MMDHIDDFRPDVMVFGAPHPLAFMGPGISESTDVPFAVMTHGAEFLLPNRVPGFRNVVLKPLVAADVVFAVSAFTASEVASAAGRRVVRLGAGVDLDTFHPPDKPPSKFVIGCVSRMVPRKGHAVVLEAADRLFRAGHPVSVLLVGSGRLEDRLRRQAAAGAVPVRFEVDVPWERLPDLYREMSVFAMPARSRWGGLEAEGLGIVYLEAAASGLPVVAGSSGGAPETVVPGITGWIADDVGSLARVLERILTEGSAARVGAKARIHAETEFSWDAVLDRWAEALAPIV